MNEKRKTKAIELLRTLDEAGYTIKDMIESIEIATGEAQNNYERNLKVRIYELFKKIGVPMNSIGYYYLKRGVELIYIDKNYRLGLVNGLYSKIANEYSVSAGSVERSMRTSIERMFNNIDSGINESIFGKTLYCMKKKPSNSIFFAAIVEHLKMEDEEE